MPIPWTEYLVFAVYYLIGPGAWSLIVIGMYQTYKRVNVVKRPRAPLPNPAPRVTILIPAKDEQERIGECLLSALKQDYPNFNVIAVNDRSNDDTGKVMDEVAARNPRLSVLHLTELPAGWTGKCHALFQGAQRADGEWLLCFDSDVVLQPDALSATVGVAIKKDYGLVSLLPKMESHSLWEGLLVPLAGAAVTALFAAAWTNSADHSSAFGNGQFILFRRDAYNASGGHEAVRDQYCEDMALARIFKSRGWRPRVSWGTDLCSVRMYDSFPKIMRGWSRIFYAAAVGSPWRSIGGILFILICCYSVVPALIFGMSRHSILWISTALMHWMMLTTQIGVMYRWTLNPRRYALAFPFTSILLIGIFVRAIWMCLTKKVEWRGTKYQDAMNHGAVTGG